MEAILLMGIQASGKSSFYKEQFGDTHVRLNLDMLRTRHREGLLFEACLAGKTKIVIDNTNVSREERKRYLPALLAAGYQIRGYFLQSNIEDCLARNRSRGGEIPDKALCATSSRLELPSLEEGFDELHFVRLADGRFVVEEWRS